MVGWLVLRECYFYSPLSRHSGTLWPLVAADTCCALLWTWNLMWFTTTLTLTILILTIILTLILTIILILTITLTLTILILTIILITLITLTTLTILTITLIILILTVILTIIRILIGSNEWISYLYYLLFVVADRPYNCSISPSR